MLKLTLNVLIQTVERAFPAFFPRQFPPGLAAAVVNPADVAAADRWSLDTLKDHILWAVPKHRRTIEKRMKRKYGSPEYVQKILLPKTNLRVCNQCGHNHEVGVLCPNCYQKVKEETELMQEAIQKELKLDPVDKEVVVLYDSERDKPSELWQGKRIVEMKKPRPLWFSKNLIEKTTQTSETNTKEVKPTDLS